MEIEHKQIAGCEVVFADLPGANSTTVEVLVKAGSIYEQPTTNGISHFLEHMFFKGGKKYPTPKVVAETMDAYGGEFNAFTSDEYAGYYVKAAPEYVETSLEVMADMLVDAQFPADELEREKDVVIQEIMMYEDMPQQLVMDKWKQWYFGNNSFGRPTLGTVDNLKSFGQQHLFDHKRTLYTKDNLVIIVAGNLHDQQKIESAIGDLFAPLPDRTTVSPPVYPDHRPDQQQNHYDKGTQQNHLVIAAHSVDMHHPERFAAKLLGVILGGTMSSRLFQEIREKMGLCYYIAASHHADDTDGLFIIRAGLEKQRWTKGLKAIYAQIAKLVDGEITQTELDNALGNVKGKTQMGIESSDQLAHFVGMQQLFRGEVHSLEEILRFYETVTLDQLHHVAQRLADDKLYAYRIE